MPDIVKRGYIHSDEKEFIEHIGKLRSASEELYYLINCGYQIKPASTFVGNRYLLSERQRLALVRSISPKDRIKKDSITYAFQSKCYDRPIGVKAVQGVYSGRDYYDRMIGVVITNRYFTEPAIKLASKLKIILWDRDFIKEFQ